MELWIGVDTSGVEAAESLAIVLKRCRSEGQYTHVLYRPIAVNIKSRASL